MAHNMKFQILSLSLTILSASVYCAPESKSTPTFYYRIGDIPNPKCPAVQSVSAEFKDARTSCGNLMSEVGKYGVAIADGGSQCGKKISVTSDTGKSMELTVYDTCPQCSGDNHLDMSLDALLELFDGDATKACGIDREIPKVSWKFV